jgi:hypothetical protein
MRSEFEVQAEFEALSAVVVKSTVFWGTMPSTPPERNRLFGGQIASILRDEDKSKQCSCVKHVASKCSQWNRMLDGATAVSTIAVS